MKILVTGADGFLGSNTVRYFKDRGYNVTAYTQDVKHSMPYETYDVLYHFAAFVGGRKGIDNNTWLVAKNIEIDRTVFEWAETHCGKIVYPSSCAAYPLWTQTSTDITMKENLPLDSVYDVYGLSKVTSERMLAYTKTRSDVVRIFSSYGPDQTLDYPMPSIIARAKQGECSVWGTGTQTRDWVYIDDVLRVFEYLLTHDVGVLNIGTGIATSFHDLAQTIYHCMHGVTVPVSVNTTEPEGASHRCADTTLLHDLGLKPVTSLEQGIQLCLKQ
jgi:nucleoside-diphosphate-sugar epimerase